MIVCSCNVITDHDVRSAVKTADAPRTTGEIYGCLGCSPQCGRCARTIRRIAEGAAKQSPAAAAELDALLQFCSASPTAQSKVG